MTPEERARKIKILICDVDGVLTDGRLIYHADGSESKSFHTLDGIGLQALRSTGVSVQWLTARSSAVVARRAEELGVTARQGARDKLAALTDICAEGAFQLSDVAFIGDDWLDLPALMRVGFACTVPNSAPEVRARAHWVSRARGGEGAVRELCEVIMRAQGTYEKALARYVP